MNKRCRRSLTGAFAACGILISAVIPAAAKSVPEAGKTIPAISSVMQKRTISTSQIQCGLSEAYSESFLDQVRSGSKFLYYEPGDSASARKSLNEVVSYYCSMDQKLQFYLNDFDSTPSLELTDASWQILSSQVSTADQDWQAYRKYVASTATSLSVNASDEVLVDEIMQFVCSEFDYAVTNRGMPHFLKTRQGQCWHYAKLFADLCQSLSIPCSVVGNADHVWNEVTVSQVRYTFDPSAADRYNNIAGNSWKNPVPLTSSAQKPVPNSQSSPNINAAGALVTGWKLTNSHWTYIKANGQPARSCWINIDQDWYYFDSQGCMMTSSWICSDRSWYHCSPYGIMERNKWIADGSQWFYTGHDGRMYKNRWLQDAGFWYYFGSDGSMARNEWIHSDGTWYWIDGAGHMS